VYDGDYRASLGSWTAIADDDPRIPFCGYARQYADREIREWRQWAASRQPA